MKLTYKSTRRACYLAYITQAAVNNLPPLLFLTFNRELGVSLSLIGLLVVINFGVQTLTDLAAAKFIDKIGYRVGFILACVCCTLGLGMLGNVASLPVAPYAGIIICTVLNAIGGGLMEVMVSPVVEALPTERKSSSMSILHSFYCWGYVGVVLLSTLFFSLAGIENWGMLTALWAILPLTVLIMFTKVPIYTLCAEEERIPFGKLLKKRIFWALMILMLCAGAAEQSVAQWASLFAEAGLGVSKTMGDLLGPCAFAFCMGAGRLLFGIFGHKIRLNTALIISSVMCVFSFALTVFAPYPILSLIGVALCGFSVAIMWPAVTSLSAIKYPLGGTGLFAMLALGGDIGCAAGSGLVGFVSDSVGGTESGIKAGILVAVLFPVVMAAILIGLRKKKRE